MCDKECLNSLKRILWILKSHQNKSSELSNDFKVVNLSDLSNLPCDPVSRCLQVQTHLNLCIVLSIGNLWTFSRYPCLLEFLSQPTQLSVMIFTMRLENKFKKAVPNIKLRLTYVSISMTSTFGTMSWSRLFKQFPLGSVRKLQAHSVGPFKVLQWDTPNVFDSDVPPDPGISSTFNVRELIVYPVHTILPDNPLE